MLYLPNDEMFINKFVRVEVPTKHQIFARTGQKSSDAGAYSGDKSADYGKSNTQSASEFLKDAENFNKESKDE